MSQDTLPPTSYISPITPADRDLLLQTIMRWRPSSKRYEDSWGYIIQATRYKGFKWHDPKTGSLLFFGEKSPSNSTLVIQNFVATPAYLARTVKTVRKLFKTPQIILKNIDVKDVDKYYLYGFRPYKENENWNDLARFDDQTYPQLFGKLQNIIQMKSHGYRYLKKALAKNPNAYIRTFRKQDKKDVFAIFAAKDGTTNQNIQTQKMGMYYESHYMYPAADLDKFVIINNDTNEIIGFTALSAITEETTAFVASLFKPNTGSASIWGEYYTLLAIYQKGYRKVNFGGSETHGTYNFVRRLFRPTEEIQKTHLIYDL